MGFFNDEQEEGKEGGGVKRDLFLKLIQNRHSLFLF